MFRLSMTALAAAGATMGLAVSLNASSADAIAVHRPAMRLPAPASAGSGAGLAAFLHGIDARYVRQANFPSLSVDVSTPMRNAAGLKAYAQAASNPRSLYYRHFLTPGAIADSFGTPAAQYAKTLALFKREGLTVKPWNQRNFITVSGSSQNLTRAFGTQFGVYQMRNRLTRKIGTFVAPSTGSKLDPAVGSISLGRMMTLVTRMRTDFVGGPAVPVSGSFSNARINGATPFELSRAYDYTGAYAAGFTGKGVNLGIVGTGPITQGNSAANDDIFAYRKTFNVPGKSTVTIDAASVNGDTAPPPVTGPANCAGLISSLGLPVPLPINDPTGGSSESPSSTCNPEDVEAQLDTEQTSMLAYDSNVLFYLAYNAANDEQGLAIADDELAQAVSDNQADILSLSYGECELLEVSPELGSLTGTAGGDATGADPTFFQELAAEGIAVFVSTGDTGSAGCQREPGNEDNPDGGYPATDPNVVAVGGTTTPMLPTGALSGPITTWGSQTKSGGAEGAGASALFVMPSFQTSVSTVATACAAAATTTLAASGAPPTSATLTTNRCVPDVVGNGDPFTGAAVIFNTGLNGGGEMEEPVGGTSESAPAMAAMWALVLSACEVTTSCGSGSSANVIDSPTPPFAPTNPSPHKFRLGNPNFLWYPLAAAASSAQYHQTFYDITFGDDAVPPYAAQLASSEAGGEGANVNSYAATDAGAVSAGPGYDSATGLGAPFARALIKFVVGV